MIGKTILHYRILEKLGEGGMGIVYKAEDTKLKREVAIKFLPPYVSSNEEERKRFEIEAQAAASLNHTNITTIYSTEEVNDEVFIVMEYIDGKELKDKIKTGPVSTEEAINIAIQIAEGLEAAHKKGIVHRDIKSGNIMITENGKVKIMDFGLAKVGKGTQVTKIGSTVGTIAYMSPEQAKGDEVDHRTDIWSFGIVLYEMLTGKQPFKGDYDQAVIYSILNEEPETIKNISSELNTIVQKALAKDPAERYQSAKEIFDDLAELKSNSFSKAYFQASKHKLPLKKKNKKWFVPAAIIIFVAFLFTAYIYFNSLSESSEISPVRKMIVVLPFENLGSPDDNYFADGITEEITSKLASIGSLGVISRNSAVQFAKSNKSTKEIGKELGVDYMLEGTIRWAKGKDNQNRVRITPQLIRISDDTHIWADSYDRVLDDIFKIQNQIAQKVVDQLGGYFVSPEIKKAAQPTDNLAAYDFYLQGLAYIRRGENVKSNIQNSTNLYKKALELDPNFALAYANISKNLSSMYHFYFDRSDNNLKEALNYAQKSFQLNQNLAGVHLAFGYYYYWCKLNYNEAIEEFSKALKLQPNSAEAYMAAGYVYRRMGNFKLALRNMLKGLSLDPLSNEYTFNTAETYSLLRDYSNANKYFKQNNDLNPDNIYNKILLALNYIDWKGDTKTAADIVRESKNSEYLDAFIDIDVLIDVLDRNYDRAIQKLKSSKIDYESGQFRYIPNDLEAGLVYRYKNEPELSKTYFESSRLLLEKM
ncbi:MAG: protein kinase domain-containing protein, partial [Ignavibacteria bacterium]